MLSVNAALESANFVLSSTLFRDGNISPKRTAKCFEMVFFISDGGGYCVNGKDYKIKANDIRFLRPGDEVQSTAYNDIYVIHFKSDMSFLTEIPVKTSGNDDIREVFGEICGCFSENDLPKTAERLFYLIMFLMRKNGIGNAEDPIARFIDEHYKEKLTLSFLSEKFFLHPVYLERKFKKQTGQSVGEYIKSVRLKNAKRLLTSTGLSSEEIAFLCGFCNPSYFVKVFKDKYGLTPGEYRKSFIFPC